jgi:PPOX class probable F420-dependent enzyme
MRLDTASCSRLLVSSDHGVLSTIGTDGQPDAVPVCFAFVDGRLAVPVDDVKPKTSERLQREENLERDGRATLLCEHWDARDWSRLWWVRARLRFTNDTSDGDATMLGDALRAKYPPYAAAVFHRLLIFDLLVLTGWAASPGPR